MTQEVSEPLPILDYVVNVSQVHHRSPFRYPGGKTWLVPRIRQWLRSRSKVKEFIEPFCGGAIVGLSVAFELLADHVTLVEIDPEVSSVWKVVLRGSEADLLWLTDRIVKFQISREMVEETLSKPTSDSREIAFRTVLRNRVNHGGCLAHGAGMIKNGENGKGVGSRWYPDTIIKRLKELFVIRDRISFLEGDGIQYIDSQRERSDVAFLIDPPYWVAGTRLYDYSEIDHRLLFEVTSRVKGSFLMTYDNAEPIKHYAQQFGFDTRQISMQNKNHSTQRELLISKDFSWLNNDLSQLELY